MALSAHLLASLCLICVTHSADKTLTPTSGNVQCGSGGVTDTCTINCNSGAVSSVNCGTYGICVLNCGGHSCMRAITIDSTNSKQLTMTVTGSNCIELSTVLLPANGGQAFITINSQGDANKEDMARRAVFTSQNSGEIEIVCRDSSRSYIDTCEAITVSASDADFLRFTCDGADCMEDGNGVQMRIECPTTTTYSGSEPAPCIIYAENALSTYNMKIHAALGSPQGVVFYGSAAASNDYSGTQLICSSGTANINAGTGSFTGRDPCWITLAPSSAPSTNTTAPTESTTADPTRGPTRSPTIFPTSTPTNIPTSNPTDMPTNMPTNSPTNMPTNMPTNNPTVPTYGPTNYPSLIPSQSPTAKPTEVLVIGSKSTRGGNAGEVVVETTEFNNDLGGDEDKLTDKQDVKSLLYIIVAVIVAIFCCLCLVYGIRRANRKKELTKQSEDTISMEDNMKATNIKPNMNPPFETIAAHVETPMGPDGMNHTKDDSLDGEDETNFIEMQLMKEGKNRGNTLQKHMADAIDNIINNDEVIVSETPGIIANIVMDIENDEQVLNDVETSGAQFNVEDDIDDINNLIDDGEQVLNDIETVGAQFNVKDDIDDINNVIDDDDDGDILDELQVNGNGKTNKDSDNEYDVMDIEMITNGNDEIVTFGKDEFVIHGNDQ